MTSERIQANAFSTRIGRVTPFPFLNVLSFRSKWLKSRGSAVTSGLGRKFFVIGNRIQAARVVAVKGAGRK